MEFVIPGEFGDPEIRKTVHDRPAWMAPFFNIFQTHDNDIDSRAVRVANADQPRGRIPRLIPVMPSPRAHILFARCIHLDSLLRSMAEAPELTSRTASMCTRYEYTTRIRSLVMRQVQYISESIASSNERLRSVLPLDSPARALNLALIEYLSVFTQSPDTSLLIDLVRGMHLTGTIPSAGSLPPATNVAKQSLAQVLRDVRTRNEGIISSLKRRPPEAILKCFEMTENEIAEGKVSELRPVTSDILSTHVLNPRFVIEQNKPRLIDDLKASGVNDTTSCSDTYKPDTLDNLILQMKRIRSVDPNADMKAFTFDFKSAYKHIGISDESDAVSRLVLLNPNDGLPYWCKMKCQPFGSRVSPRNWGRIVSLIQRIARKLFNIILFCYVDDGFAVEPAECVDSAYSCILFLTRILGFNLAPDKLVPPTSDLDLLGANIRIEKNRTVIAYPEEKRKKTRTLIRHHLKTARMSSADAATIRGKLGFTQQLCQGRFGKIMIRELAKKQYSSIPSNKLRKPVRRELRWWVKMLKRLPDRSVSFKPPKNNLVYSDASGGGGVSIGTLIVRFDAKGPKYPAYSGHAPGWCSSANIYTLEILAACTAAAHLVQLRGSGYTIFFIDNEAACAALVRGTSDHEPARSIIGAFWRICIENRITPWIERVSSANNPADEPSRGEISNSDVCTSHKFSEIPFLKSEQELRRFANWLKVE